MAPSTPVLDAPTRPIPRSPGGRVTHDRALRTRRPRRARGGARRTVSIVTVFVLFLTATTIAAPLLSPYSADDIDFDHRLESPSWQHPFGTDEMGRDLFVRVMMGGRISLLAGALATLVALVVGVTLGALAGFTGGIVDAVAMRLTDTALSVPVFLIVLLVSSLVPPGLLVICLLVGLTQWMEIARVVRSVVIATRRLAFVEAARALGIPESRILWRHVLTHTGGAVLVAGTIGFAQAITFESALSFLGFGLAPPRASWGSLLQNAQMYLDPAPWLGVFPGLMIFATVVCCHILGDALRPATRP